MKRVCDILLVLVSTPFWLPLLLLTALVVLCVEGRPLFFTQARAGLGGKPFRIVKFRSMKSCAGTDAERLGRFGRLLRATSLDELPELLLVLTGTMSLVGPRPLPTIYLPRYSPTQARRHEVRPGITGWAQVHGRNQLSWEDKFAYDVWYVDHRTPWLDFKILFMTIATVFGARGIAHDGEATMGEFKGTPET